MALIDLPSSELDRKWINAVYGEVKRNKRPSYRSIRTQMRDVLPEKFNPKKIDKRLVGWSGVDLTILGVDLTDPKYDIFAKTNAVIKAIREIIINSPNINKVETAEIATKVGIPLNEVAFILTLIAPYGNFWSTAHSSNNTYGYTSLGIEDSNDAIFDQYLYFTSIETLILEHYKQQLDSNLNRDYEEFASLDLETSNPQSSEKLIFNPIFKSRIAQKNKSLCFILMPFNESWSNSVYNKIREVVESFRLQCVRADNLHGSIIIEDIWVQLNQASFIIADVTNRNPNVMYELGIAHTIGTPTLLVTQDLKEIPFDFKHLRHIQYQNALDGWAQAELKIREFFKAHLGLR